MHRKVHEAFAAVGHPVSELLAKNDSRHSLTRREPNSCLHLFRTTPPRRVPEWPVEDLLSRVSAPVDGQAVHFAHVALQIHDASENPGLVEKGFEFGGSSRQITHQTCLLSSESPDRRNVAIDLKHCVIIIAVQLHSAVYNDFAAIFADVL